MPNRGKGKGKGKKAHRKVAPDNPTTPACTFPKEIISNILTRLPVKIVLRLRCVCKQWRSLISSPRFISAHLSRSKTILFFHARETPLSVIIKSFESAGRPVSQKKLLNPNQVKSRSSFGRSMVAGCVNGVLCMSQPPWASVLGLWNPTTHVSKHVFHPGPRPDPNVNTRVSVGLGYDSRTDDYKIIYISCFNLLLGITDQASVYSLRTGRWKAVKSDLYFWVIGTRCDAVINGMPYWRAVAKDAVGVRAVLVYFDVEKEAFDLLSLPWIMNQTDAYVGEFKGSLGMVVWPESKEKVKEQVFDVWLMDDENGWIKKYTVGPISIFERVVGFYDDFGIVGEDGEGKLLLYNLESLEIEDTICIPCAGPGTIDVVRFKESMVPIAGSGGMI